MNDIKLSNGVLMPSMVMGTSVDDRSGNRKKLINDMCSFTDIAIKKGMRGFDTSREYENEKKLGIVFRNAVCGGYIKRDELFITTKVGNRHQMTRNMTEQLEISLNNLRVDYIDLLLLHWPLPDYYLDNWHEMCELYDKGLIKAIGIANCRERHIDEIVKSNARYLPHVIQIEYHPFRTVNRLRQLCLDNKIQIEAYSANCLMLPFVRNNDVLNDIAKKHGKTIPQVIMKWHIQQGSIPIFSTLNEKHLLSNIDIDDFWLSDDEMNSIFGLDCDYKFHPESVNCPGY